MHFAMVAKLWGLDVAGVACCVFHFSPACLVLECWISRMRSQWHFANQIIVLPPRPTGAICVRQQNFHHSGGSISVEGSSAKNGDGGAVLESSSGVAGDGSGCLW